jgi:programmed cell death protein 5
MADKNPEKENEDAKVKTILKSLLEQDAYDRMANIRISSPELYSKLASIIISLAQRGQIKKKITEEQLKLLVSQILSQKREGSIMRITK